MSVDIKSLRIGSHVMWNGKRRKVDAITEEGMAFRIADTERKMYDSATIESVEPIAITPELLKELGFEDDKTDIVKRGGGYFICFHQINNLRWRVSLEGENCTNYGNTLCRYLKERRIRHESQSQSHRRNRRSGGTSYYNFGTIYYQLVNDPDADPYEYLQLDFDIMTD